MSSFALHEALAGTGESWLIHLADPVRRAPAPPGFPDATSIEALFAAAESHGVLPAVVRGVRTLLEEKGLSPSGHPGIAADLEAARLKLAYQTGFGMLLSHHADRAMQALCAAGVAAAVVKGAAFARRLYSDPSLRTFTDVDILVPQSQRNAAANVMRDLAFELFEFEDRRGKDYHEQKWLLPQQKNVMIEVHSNLVHSPKLRGSMSLTYEDVLAAGNGDSNAPTALLLVAAAHAAVGHQFDRLQQLVDITQAARGAAGSVDHRQLAVVARQCGVTLAIAAALDLAGRTFREPAATELARLIMPGHLHRLPCLMLSPRLVVRAQSKARGQGSWRRKLFRQAMRIA